MAIYYFCKVVNFGLAPIISNNNSITKSTIENFKILRNFNITSTYPHTTKKWSITSQKKLVHNFIIRQNLHENLEIFCHPIFLSNFIESDKKVGLLNILIQVIKTLHGKVIIKCRYMLANPMSS
jgi:hypothetical protein